MMNSFFFFMIDEATRYARWAIQHKGDTMWIILLISYMIEENLFVYVKCSSVKHAASRFSVRKNVTKKKKRQKESDTWMD